MCMGVRTGPPSSPSSWMGSSLREEARPPPSYWEGASDPMSTQKELGLESPPQPPRPNAQPVASIPGAFMLCKASRDSEGWVFQVYAALCILSLGTLNDSMCQAGRLSHCSQFTNQDTCGQQAVD